MQDLLLYLILINALGLILMHQDKRSARLHRARVPEAVLLGIAILGGAGAITLSMVLFRHKTKKPRFSIGVPVLLLLQISIFLFKFT